MAYLLLHNPQCSKSREAHRILEERGVAFQVREYLKEPLGLDELRVLGKRLRRPPHEWLRWKEAEAAEAGVTRDDPPMRLYQAMADHPRLMERPILVHEDEAVVGRPDAAAIESLLPPRRTAA